MSDSSSATHKQLTRRVYRTQTYFFHPAKKLVRSRVVSLGFCEQLAQALDRKWNSTIEGERGGKKKESALYKFKDFYLGCHNFVFRTDML